MLQSLPCVTFVLHDNKLSKSKKKNPTNGQPTDNVAYRAAIAAKKSETHSTTDS